MKNEIVINQQKITFIPSGDGMIPVAQVKRANKGFIPTHARFKATLYWADSGLPQPYPSWEIAKRISERAGYERLKSELLKKNPDVYASIVIYTNLTNNLSVSEKNYELSTCLIVNGKILREIEMIWAMMDQLDVHAMRRKYNLPLK